MFAARYSYILDHTVATDFILIHLFSTKINKDTTLYLDLVKLHHEIV